jgi:hypothetical protein
MSSVCAPLVRIEERALRIGLGIKGSSQGEVGLPEFFGLAETLDRREGVPFGPFISDEILGANALHVS